MHGQTNIKYFDFLSLVKGKNMFTQFNQMHN